MLANRGVSGPEDSEKSRGEQWLLRARGINDADGRVLATFRICRGDFHSRGERSEAEAECSSRPARTVARVPPLVWLLLAFYASGGRLIVAREAVYWRRARLAPHPSR